MNDARVRSTPSWLASARAKVDAATVAKLLLLAFAVWTWIEMFRHLHEVQWDFRIYYHAAKAHLAGRDPYDAGTVAHFARRRVLGGYAYPPATLVFFKPFTLVGYDLARQLFFGLKTLLVIGLVVLWRTRFSDARAALVLYLACLFAFNNTIYLDLRAGNISLVEQALLWPAFYCFTRQKLVPFCVLVLLASAFKQVPILFLGLLLVEPDRKRVALLFASLAAYAAYALVSRAAEPELFLAFLENAAKTNTESKILNPSSFAFSNDLVGLLFGGGGEPVNPALGKGLYASIVLVVLGLTGWAMRRLRRVEAPQRYTLYVFLACFAYALCVPRFKDYSFVLLVAPAAHIVYTYASQVSARPLVLVLLCLPLINIPMPGLQSLALIVPDYYPLLVAALLWVLYLCYARDLGDGAASACLRAAVPPK